MIKLLLSTLMLFSAVAIFSQSQTGVRVYSGKCAVSQTGSGSGYWEATITGFNDPGGNIDAGDIEIGDFLQFSDSGTPYALEITQIMSASGQTATFRVDNSGITGISSIPTTSNAFVSRRTVNFGLTPIVSNMSDNDNQLQQEFTMYKIDSLLGKDAAFFSTSDTLVFSPAGKTPVNGDFITHNRFGNISEKKNGFWNFRSNSNGLNVRRENATTLPYGTGTVTINGSQNRYYYVLINEDVTFNNPTNLEFRDGAIYRILVENNTDEGQSVNWAPATFRANNPDIAMPTTTISAYSKRLYTFQVLNFEIPILQSMDDVLGQISRSGWYTPTVTRSILSDTTVTVYPCFFEVNGNVGTLSGKVLVNNLTSTITSSFRISMPSGVTTNFTNALNDVGGTVTSQKQSPPTNPYAASCFADVANDQVTLTYNTDGSSSTRQLVEFNVKFRIQ